MAYQSELKVITAAKMLASYVMTVTQKSPKQFRFSLVAKLQTYALDTVENLYKANEVYISSAEDTAGSLLRLKYQREAMGNLKLLGYMAQLSVEQGCLQLKQLEQIGKLSLDCQNLIGAWINSDRRRYTPKNT